MLVYSLPIYMVCLFFLDFCCARIFPIKPLAKDSIAVGLGVATVWNSPKTSAIHFNIWMQAVCFLCSPLPALLGWNVWPKGLLLEGNMGRKNQTEQYQRIWRTHMGQNKGICGLAFSFHSGQLALGSIGQDMSMVASFKPYKLMTVITPLITLFTVQWKGQKCPPFKFYYYQRTQNTPHLVGSMTAQ